jgi:hypothetical protein
MKQTRIFAYHQNQNYEFIKNCVYIKSYPIICLHQVLQKVLTAFTALPLLKHHIQTRNPQEENIHHKHTDKIHEKLHLDVNNEHKKLEVKFHALELLVFNEFMYRERVNTTFESFLG